MSAPVIDLGHLDLGDLEFPTWSADTDRSPIWRRVLRRVRLTEIGALTIVALAGYIAVAYWIRYGLHFYINDALNRTDDALYVTVSRDPHLAAIGFYWPPLPQLIQIPLVPIFYHFHETIMAGPISSAICMALTIPVLARIGRLAGLHRRTTFFICLAFAVNPVIIYYAGIGMSEACFFTTGAVAMLGFLGYTQTRSTKDMLIFSAGLSGAILTRLEGPFLVVALVVVATFNLRHLRRSAWEAFLIAAPPYACFGLWLVVQWIIEGNPLFFRDQTGGSAPPSPGHAVWLPDTASDPLRALPWAVDWVFVLGPAVFLVALMVFLRPRSGRTRAWIGIVAGMSVFPVIQIEQVITGTGFGDPRYFVTAILFATVGALWIAARPAPKGRRILGAPPRALWNVALVGVLVASGAYGSYSLTSGRVTHVEDECTFFQYGVAQVIPELGRKQYGPFACNRPPNGLKPWEEADAWLDHHITKKDRILADNSVNFPATLFTDHANQFIVENDRDFKKIVANPVEVTYIVTQAPARDALPYGNGASGGDAGAELIDASPHQWKLVASYPSWVQVWHFVPSKEYGLTPTGPESDLA